MNGKGRFQNVIDPEGASKNGVVNGASFNYANKNDYNSKKKNDPKSVHGRLDVNIEKVDPKWRKETINNNDKKFDSPKSGDGEFSYSNKEGRYSINGESSEQNSKNRKREFESEIRNSR